MAERSLRNTHDFIDKAARHHGWKPNPDAEFVATVAAGLTTNVNRHGYYLCPCRDGDGDRKRDKDIVCPCVYAGPDVDQHGQCFCGLFVSADHEGPVRQIHERRHGDW